MYRPNFCAECGTRIERARWRLWTSRRFCDACAKRFSSPRIALPLLLCATLLGLSFTLGRALRPPAPPLIIASNAGQVAPLPASLTDIAPRSPQGATSLPPAPQYGPDGSASERPTEPQEIVSICGARTKKGTPCTRRVRGTGRCWQHKGMPAMLPAEKLLVKDK